MNFLEFASSRWSVRSFTPEHLSREEIQQLLAAGHIAPTGCNNQPQRILVLNSDESMEKLKACTKCHFNAPAALLVCWNTEEIWTRKYDGQTSGPYDAAIVATHLMLQAHALGIGCTWVMHFDPAAMRKTFAIPEEIQPAALLVMGHPAPDAAPLPLHSRFRPLEETVVWESWENSPQ